MPLPFILGALAAIGGAAGTVAGAAATIGAITILGVSLSTILAWVGGLWLFVTWTDAIEEGGIKYGYERASREYEKKLNKQAELFLKELNDAKDEISAQRIARAKAEKFGKEMAKLCGEYEGLLRKYEEEGETPLEATLNYYHSFQEFKKQAKAA